MADLDEFFAKKDKKKGKAKKFVVASPPVPPAVEKESEEVQRQTSEPAKLDVGIDIPTAPTQDNDWKEENVPTQDFEGLKIQPLRTDDIVKEEEKTYNEPDEESITTKGETVKTYASPWQTKVEQQAPLPPPSEGPVGAYVPPSRRDRPQMQQKGPPNIMNPQAFPSLQASVQISQNKDKTSDKDFQKVRSKSGKSQDFTPPSIELTNKFDALQEN